MSQPLNPLLRVLFALALLVPATLATSPTVAASVAVAPMAHAQVVTSHTIATTTTCGDSLGRRYGREGLICDVTIANTFTATGGSAVVTVPRMLRLCWLSH